MSREMKDSGIAWIGEIPNGWEVSRYKYFATSRMGETILSEDTREEGIPIYSATQDDKIFGYVEKSNIILTKGDFVIPARGNSIGCISIVKEDIATCTQTTICSRNIRNINSLFLYYCGWGLKNEWFKYDGSAIPQVTINQINNNILPLPPLPEQQKIAEFLDRKCGEIDELVALQEKMIEELKAYKQSVITEAVTKGLNPNAPMKDSGIEWIDYVPKHWQIRKMKSIIDLKSGSNLTAMEISEMDDGYLVYGGNGVRGTYGYYSHEGDYVLIGRQGALCGNINYASGKFWVTEHALVCYLKESCALKWLGELLRAMNLNQYSLSAAQPGLSAERIRNLYVIVPPLSEQQQIADYLDKKCAEIDELVAVKQQKIETLKEYKKSLIYEYVTGKKEVI